MQMVQVAYPEGRRGTWFSAPACFVYNEWCSESLQMKHINSLVDTVIFYLFSALTTPYFRLPGTRKAFMVKNYRTTVDTGQRSPVKLFSSLPGRALLTLLLFVHTWAWKPGFGVPLKNTHTCTQTDRIYEQRPWEDGVSLLVKWQKRSASTVASSSNLRVLNLHPAWNRLHTDLRWAL